MNNSINKISHLVSPKIFLETRYFFSCSQPLEPSSILNDNWCGEWWVHFTSISALSRSVAIVVHRTLFQFQYAHFPWTSPIYLGIFLLICHSNCRWFFWSRSLGVSQLSCWNWWVIWAWFEYCIYSREETEKHVPSFCWIECESFCSQLETVVNWKVPFWFFSPNFLQCFDSWQIKLSLRLQQIAMLLSLFSFTSTWRCCCCSSTFLSFVRFGVFAFDCLDVNLALVDAIASLVLAVAVTVLNLVVEVAVSVLLVHSLNEIYDFSAFALLTN